MRKLFVLLLLMLNVCSRVMCQTSVDAGNYHLVLWLHDGGQVDFPFDEKPCICTSEGIIKVRTSLCETNYSYEDVHKFTLMLREGADAEVGIKDLSSKQTQVRNDGNVITFSNFPVEENVNVYDMSGRLYNRHKIQPDGSLDIPLSQYPCGVYVFRIKNLTYKFSK